MQVTMGTSPTESMAAAGNIFLGQVHNCLNNKQQQKANHGCIKVNSSIH